MNTAVIIASQTGDNQTGNFAAKVAANYRIQDNGVTACTTVKPPPTETCYGDWYLPSRVELNLLYKQKAVVGGFASNTYWSSTEYGSGLAWGQAFGDGSQNYYGKGYTLSVRAVRAF
jgi:Protein of unknown function (DUF1566)